MVTISYCGASDVRRAISFPSIEAPISDSDIEEFIADAEEEIERIYHTKFGAVGVSEAVDSATDSTLTATGDFTDEDYSDYVVWITGGLGSGQYRNITSNTNDVLTVSPDWTTNPDNTSTYKVVKLGFREDTVDGSGTDKHFVTYQPLISLVSLTIDSTDVTVSSVYQYDASGKLVLSTDAEKTVFTDTYPQLVDWKYSYGVYPFPRIIKRLCAVIAAIKTLVAQISGTYDDFTSVSLPGGFTGSKGEPYTNIREAVTRLQQEAKGIVYGEPSNALGAGYNKLPAFRPYSFFG